MKIMITGSKGQLGHALIKILETNEFYELIPCDVDQLNITDLDEVKQFIDIKMPNCIINCAAYTAVDACEDNEEIAFSVNAIGPRNLAIASFEKSIELIHVSTDYIFDGSGNKDLDNNLLPYIESDMPRPQTAYGRTKLAGEQMVIQHNPRHYIIRTAWLYGEGNNFVRTMLSLALKNRELKVVNDQIGSPTSAKELAMSISTLIGSSNYGLFHGTCEGSCSWYDFAKEIFELTNTNVEVKPCTTEEFPRPAKRPAYSVLDNRMFRVTNGYKFAEWKKALKEYLISEGYEL